MPGRPRKLNKIELRGDHAVIHIESKAFGHLECLIDAADVPLVEGRTWSVNRRRTKAPSFDVKTTLYPPEVERQTGLLLVHLLLGKPPGLEVDHIDGNSLNNRRSNLRLVSHTTNARNRIGRGYAPHGRGYRAYITIDRRLRYLGIFDTEEEARAAHLAAKRELHGVARAA